MFKKRLEGFFLTVIVMVLPADRMEQQVQKANFFRYSPGLRLVIFLKSRLKEDVSL